MGSADKLNTEFDTTVVGATGGGVLGALTGIVPGALTGFVSSLVNPATLVGFGLGGATALVGAYLGVNGDGVGGSGMNMTTVVGLSGMALVPAAHTLGGALVGMGIGGGIGLGLGGIKGALVGADKAEQEELTFEKKKGRYKAAQKELLNEERAAAAEQYTMLGYQQAAQEIGPAAFQQGVQYGANQVAQQIIAAHEAQAKGGEKKFTDTVVKKSGDTHVQAVESKSQPTVQGPMAV